MERIFELSLAAREVLSRTLMKERIWITRVASESVSQPLKPAPLHDERPTEKLLDVTRSHRCLW